MIQNRMDELSMSNVLSENITMKQQLAVYGKVVWILCLYSRFVFVTLKEQVHAEYIAANYRIIQENIVIYPPAH